MEEKDEEGNVFRVDGRLTSEALAVLIIDALMDAKIVDKADSERALAIATEEIDVRKAAGDY